MGWFKLVVELIPVIGNIFAILGRKKAQKKAERIEKVLGVTIQGIEAYRNKDQADPIAIQSVIKHLAVATGIEDKLHELVVKYTTPKLK